MSFPCIRAGAIYERKYLLGTSMARPVIAKVSGTVLSHCSQVQYSTALRYCARRVTGQPLAYGIALWLLVIPCLALWAWQTVQYCTVQDSLSLPRFPCAQAMVDVAKQVGADAVAHGCTGKGNDQVFLPALHCSVQCCSALHCAILYCAVLNCTACRCTVQ